MLKVSQYHPPLLFLREKDRASLLSPHRGRPQENEINPPDENDVPIKLLVKIGKDTIHIAPPPGLVRMTLSFLVLSQVHRSFLPP